MLLDTLGGNFEDVRCGRSGDFVQAVLPWTTKDLRVPSSARASAISLAVSGEGAPINCALARAGFTSGPRRLNTVRVFSSRRTGWACFIAGCSAGANRNPMPISRIDRAASSGVTSVMRTPKASRTSALPLLLDIDRLPCLATCAPAPAITIATAVETLNVPEPSPPVPQVSITSRPGVHHDHAIAHGPRESSELGGGFAFHFQGDQEPGDLRFAGLTLEQHAHGLVGFFPERSEPAATRCK